MLALLATVLITPSQADDRPNIILAMADDQGWGDMAYSGHPVVQTPNFDQMAASGLRFDRFYAAAPVCSPTRGSVMTGRTPNRFGCFSWGYSLRPEEVTVAEMLKSAGYTTGHFGKWHLGSVRADSPVCPGNSGFDQWLSAANFFDLNPWLSRNGQAEQIKGESSAIVVAAALDFARQASQKKQPFLAVVWFGSPHAPHQGTEQDLKLYADQPRKSQHFLAEITAMDRALGKLRQGLRDLNIADNTLLWYTSDNGAIPEGSTGGLRARKGSIYEGGLRVPGIIEWPARIESPRATSVACCSVDILPTLAEVAGVEEPSPHPLDGQSLVSLIDDKVNARKRPLGFWSYPIAGQGVKSDQLIKELADEQASGNVKPAADSMPKQTGLLDQRHADDDLTGHSAWIDGDWKLHRIQGKGGAKPQWELYNLASDRAEEHDLLGSQPERVAAMQKQLTEWLGSVVRSLNGEDYAK
jgi:arylsulfatase A-like enzyme